MDLINYLAHRHSKKQIQQLAKQLVGDEKSLDQLVQIILEAEDPIPIYGSWLLQHISLIDTSVITSRVDKLLEILDRRSEEGVRRCVVRSMQDAEIPQQNQEALINFCFQYLENPKEAIAVKVFSITILHRLCQSETELLQLLADIIELQLPTAGPAFKSRGGKIVANIRKVLDK